MAYGAAGTRVIARVSNTVIGLTAIFAIPSIFALLFNPSALTLLWVVSHLLIARRVAQISLLVSREGVQVNNFTGTTLVPIWEAEVEVVDQTGFNPMLGDAGGRLDSEARSLVIKRRWHGDPDVSVGVAPRYGPEVDRIHNELVGAIAAQRANW